MATTSAALSVALAISGLATTPPPLGSDEEIPGGYYDAMDLRHEDEPADGDKQVTLGSVLFALGVLQVGGGIGSYVTATPRYCDQVYGRTVSPETCSGLRIYGIVGVVYGTLMTATGAAFLGWGLVQRQRHRLWLKDRGLALSPQVGHGGWGLTLQLRF